MYQKQSVNQDSKTNKALNPGSVTYVFRLWVLVFLVLKYRTLEKENEIYERPVW